MHPFRRLAVWVRRRLGDAVHRAGGATRSDLERLYPELERLRADVDSSLASINGALASTSERADSAFARTAAHDRLHGELGTRLSSLENLVAIDAVGRFVRHASLRTQPLVSVVLPTYDRPDRLRRAIDSVLAQRYTQWELLVVDDGGQLDSQAVVSETDDPRIRWTRQPHWGVCAARNAALSCARGELITYLDDDNVMDPDWLYSVVWAFEQRPDVGVLYGAIVVDDLLRVNAGSSGDLPRTFLHPWQRAALCHGNLADIGAIAHRSGLPDAQFDESLQTLGDWDLLIRLTADRDPLVLPAIACYYTSDAPDRLTDGPTRAADQATVMARAAVGLRTDRGEGVALVEVGEAVSP